jgi:hypothetical protein
MGSFTKWTEFVCTAQSEKIRPFNAGTTERWDAYYNLLMKWFVSLAILFMMVAISKLLLRI